MKTILIGLAGGIGAVVLDFLARWIYYTIKSFKDPDVIEASKLGMTITRYYIYKKMWDEIQNIYHEEGINSETDRKIDKIIMQAPNLNEWRRFGKYQEEKSRMKMFDDLHKIQNDEN